MTQGSTPENLRGGSSRRDFLKLSSGVTLLPAVLPVFGPLAGSTAVFASAQAAPGSQGGLPPHAGRGLASRRKAFEPLAYSNVDAVSLAKGFEWYAIASTGDVINAQGDRFGDCCDFTAFFEGEEGPDHGYLWVNHEYVITNVLHGRKVGASEKTREMVDAEMKLVGGSLLEIRRDKGNSGGKDPGKGNAKSAGQWKLVANSKKAFRVDANTDMPLVGPAAGIAKGQMVKGTMGNCGGGFTPWRTALSGEENVDIYYGKEPKGFNYGWGRYYDRPEEHYGWVVEVDIDSAQARKLTSLGRFAHEGATFVKAKDGRAVVYMGDDAAGRCVYKFISKGRISGRKEADKDLLLEGDLFVADLKGGKWVLLAPANEKLAADKEGRFKTLEAILVNTREAAKVAGGTPLNRPEDVKVHPLTGVVHFTLTNNAASGDFHGEVVALEEEGGDAGALRFVYDTYIAGGRKQGFSCPDNLVFGPEHSLWVCTDISDSAMGRGAHADFPRNSMLRVEADTKTGATVARHFLQSPRDAEITGPSFTPDFKTLFVAIQHPGESSFEDDKGYTSHWPDGGSAKPRSTLIGVKETSGRFA